MIKSKLLKKYKNINHGFFNKVGGKSVGMYQSLNCGTGSSDNKNHVKKNHNIYNLYQDKKLSTYDDSQLFNIRAYLKYFCILVLKNIFLSAVGLAWYKIML